MISDSGEAPKASPPSPPSPPNPPRQLGPRRLFALDHNFPEPIVKVMAQFIMCTELVPVREIDPSYSDLDDWELLLALSKHPRHFDGMITADWRMLNKPKELTVLHQTKLTLVVARGQGHNPIRATGIVLAHIEHICNQTVKHTGQIWDLSVAQKNADNPWNALEELAEAHSQTTMALFRENQLAVEELKKEEA